MANFSIDSRYRDGIVSKTLKDKDFVRTRKPLYLKEAADDKFIEVEEEFINRSDLLSYAVYKRDDLAWVIFDNNNIFDPTEDLEVGMILRIPSIDKILKVL